MKILKKLKRERKALDRAIADFERMAVQQDKPQEQEDVKSLHAVTPKKPRRDEGGL
jgi:hypothetical protein